MISLSTSAPSPQRVSGRRYTGWRVIGSWYHGFGYYSGWRDTRKIMSKGSTSCFWTTLKSQFPISRQLAKCVVSELKIKACLLTCESTINRKWNQQTFFNKFEHTYNSVRRNPVYYTAIFLSYLKKRYKTLFSITGFFLTDPSIFLIALVPQASWKLIG